MISFLSAMEEEDEEDFKQLWRNWPVPLESSAPEMFSSLFGKEPSGSLILESSISSSERWRGGLGLFYFTAQSKPELRRYNFDWVIFLLCDSYNDHLQSQEGRGGGLAGSRSWVKLKYFLSSQCAAAPIVCVVLAARPVLQAALPTSHSLSSYTIYQYIILQHIHYTLILSYYRESKMSYDCPVVYYSSFGVF